MNIVITGHVDHGKSTIIGRLLADTGSLPMGKLEAVEFRYAYLLDALKEEKACGITIDMARVFFQTPKRRYTLLDAPGHTEFLKNMVTGAANASAALLVIDAYEGIQENSKRHAHILSLLGIKQIIVLINKMDLVQYSEEKFLSLKTKLNSFLESCNLKPLHFIPVSGDLGENVAKLSTLMHWYKGATLLQALDECQDEPSLDLRPFRMPIQDVYRFSNQIDPIFAGNIESGELRVGDDVIFFPSGQKAKIKGFCGTHIESESVGAGYAIGFVLDRSLEIGRGEIVTKANEQSLDVSDHLKVSIFWLGKTPFAMGKKYFLKAGTSKVPVFVEKFHEIVDSSTLNIQRDAKEVNNGEVTICNLRLSQPLAFDKSVVSNYTNRFVIVDGYEISGGGAIFSACNEMFTCNSI